MADWSKPALGAAVTCAALLAGPVLGAEDPTAIERAAHDTYVAAINSRGCRGWVDPAY